MRHIYTPLLCIAVLLFGGCVTGKKELPNNLLPEIRKKQTVAVKDIAEEGTEDITHLSDYLRGKVEETLLQRGVDVKTRKELVALISDAEISDGDAEDKIWLNVAAEVVVSGHYSILGENAGGELVRIKVLLAANSINASKIAGGEHIITIEKTRLDNLLMITGNTTQQEMETVVGPEVKGRPNIQASLNHENKCYRPGDKIAVEATSSPGVYYYLFNLSCDGNVALLYPNEVMKNEPVQNGVFVFPPKKNSRIKAMRVAPDKPGVECKESFKLVAARERLDFSFLPFPKNKIYGGVNKDNVEMVTAILKQATQESRLLRYKISDQCTAVD